MGQGGREPTWGAAFTFDPELLCKGRGEVCRLSWGGTHPECPAP